MPAAAARRPRASAWDRDLTGALPRLEAFFTRARGFWTMSPSWTAWLRAAERTPCMTPTVEGSMPASSLRAFRARTCEGERSLSLSLPKKGRKWFRTVRS